MSVVCHVSNNSLSSILETNMLAVLNQGWTTMTHYYREKEHERLRGRKGRRVRLVSNSDVRPRPGYDGCHVYAHRPPMTIPDGICAAKPTAARCADK